MQVMQADIRSLKAEDSAAAKPEGAHKPALKSLATMEDSTKVQDTFECLPSGAKVSIKVLCVARTGECINLVDFAPVLEPTNVTETDLVEGELRRTVKHIDSFLLWSLAWRRYEEYLVERDPSLYKSLVEYRIFIQTCAAHYWWQAVYLYD